MYLNKEFFKFNCISLNFFRQVLPKFWSIHQIVKAEMTQRMSCSLIQNPLTNTTRTLDQMEDRLWKDR